MTVTVELDEETHQMLRELAKAEGCSQQDVINLCIRRDIERGEDSIMRQSMRKALQEDSCNN